MAWECPHLHQQDRVLKRGWGGHTLHNLPGALQSLLPYRSWWQHEHKHQDHAVSHAGRSLLQIPVSSCWSINTDAGRRFLDNGLILDPEFPLMLSEPTVFRWTGTAFLSAHKHQSRDCWALNKADSQAMLSGVQMLYHLLRCVLTTSFVTKMWIWPFTGRPSSFAAFFSAEPKHFKVSSYSLFWHHNRGKMPSSNHFLLGELEFWIAYTQ